MQKSLLIGFVLCAGLVGWMAARRTKADAPTGLPGAKAVLDAGNFATLHEAFEAVSKNGGVLRLPPGEFHIDKPLVVHGQDVSIVGAGTSTHIVNDNASGEAAIVISSPLVKRGGGADRAHSLWRIRIANVRITGNEKSGHGVWARYINEIHIDGVTVSEHGGDGVFLDFCYEDPRISDSLITYNKGVGVNLLGCHDIVVSANQFEENQDGLHCKDGFNLTMSGNNLDDHLGRGVVIENTYGSVVASNMIEECASDAIVLDRDCYGITLSANVIAHNGGGIDLRDAHGCAVSANTFTLMKTHALRVGPESGRIAVTGNSFCDSYIGGSQRRLEGDRQAGGVVLQGARDIAFSGNLFSGVTPEAIQNDAASSVLVSGNLFRKTEFPQDDNTPNGWFLHNNLHSSDD